MIDRGSKVELAATRLKARERDDEGNFKTQQSNKTEYGSELFQIPEELNAVNDLDLRTESLWEYVMEYLGETDKFPYSW